MMHFIRHCVIADELNDRIYMIGGVYRKRNTYYYKPSTNSWHNRGNMYYDAYVSIKYGLIPDFCNILNLSIGLCPPHCWLETQSKKEAYCVWVRRLSC